MAHTNSLNWPKLFDVSRNRVTVLYDNDAIVKRVKLLLLTEPTEVYNQPTFGVGLRQHLWKYLTENEKAIIKDKIIQQLRLWEPNCIPDETQFTDGLLFTGSMEFPTVAENQDELRFTMAIKTTLGDTLTITINNQEVPK